MAELMLVNPRKRRRRTRRKTVARKRPTTRRISTRTIRRTRRRRNPIRRKGLMGIVNTTILPSATAAAGAIGLDVIWGMAPIPDQFKTGPFRHVAKAAGAIGLGMLAEMVVKKATADLVTTGALTVVIHNAMKDGLARFAPNLALGEYLSGYDQMSYYGSGVNPAIGEYLSPDSGINLNQGDYTEF